MTPQHLGKEKIANYAISTCMYHCIINDSAYDDEHIHIMTIRLRECLVAVFMTLQHQRDEEPFLQQYQEVISM